MWTVFHILWIWHSGLFDYKYCCRSKGRPQHGRTFSIYLSPLSFWSTLRQGVQSTSWCCPSRPCVVFLACMHLALFLELSLSRQLPCFLMVWPQYASFLALTVSNSSLFTPALSRTHSFVFFAVHETRRIFLSPSSQRRQDVFLHCFSVYFIIFYCILLYDADDKWKRTVDGGDVIVGEIQQCQITQKGQRWHVSNCIVCRGQLHTTQSNSTYTTNLLPLFIIIYYFIYLCQLPSVLCRCWVGGRKGIWPVKNSGWVLAWLSVWS